QNKMNEAGPACWLVLRKDVFGKRRSYDDQTKFIKALNKTTGVGYEEELSAIDLATAVFARQVCTGERYLGDDIERKGCNVASRSKETVKDDKGVQHLLVGNFCPGGLWIMGNRCYQPRL